MTKTERSRIVALGGIGAVIILLVWGIIATLPKKEDGREEEVRLRSEIKDNFTLKDMLGSVEKEMENRRENRMPGGGNYGMDEPEDTVSPESEIQRIRELIRRNEQTLGSGPLSGTEQPAPSAFREKETTDGEEEKPGKTEPEDTVPEETSPERIQQRAPCPAGREERHTGIRTFHTDGHGRSDAEDAAGGELPYGRRTAHPQGNTGVRGGDRNRRGTGAGQNHLGESGREHTSL